MPWAIVKYMICRGQQWQCRDEMVQFLLLPGHNDTAPNWSPTNPGHPEQNYCVIAPDD